MTANPWPVFFVFVNKNKDVDYYYLVVTAYVDKKEKCYVELLT